MDYTVATHLATGNQYRLLYYSISFSSPHQSPPRTVNMKLMDSEGIKWEVTYDHDPDDVKFRLSTPLGSMMEL